MTDMEVASVQSSISSRSEYDEEEKDCCSSPVRSISFIRKTSKIVETNEVLELARKRTSQEECKDPDNTRLSELILERNWNEAVERMTEFPDEVSKEIPLRCFHGGNCRGLPLHLACALRPLPPSSFTLMLISRFPNATSYKEMQWGMLPLHFACMRVKEESKHPLEKEIRVNRHVSAIQYLLKAYPDAVRSRESFQGKLPIHLATASFTCGPSYPQVVNKLARAYPQSIYVEDDYGDTPIAIAKRIQQWRKFCVDEKQNYLAPQLSLEKDQNGLESEIVSTMFDHALHQMLREDCQKSQKSTDNAVISSVDHNDMNLVHEQTGKVFLFNVSATIQNKKFRKRLAKSNSINPFFEIYFARGKPQDSRINWSKMYRSYPIMSTSKPTWDRVSITVDPIYSDDTGVRVVFMACRINGTHKILGEVESSISELFGQSSESKQIKLKRIGKKRGKAGTVCFTCFPNEMKDSELV